MRHLIAIIAATVLVASLLTGCATTPKKATYTTLGAIGAAVDGAMKGAAQAYVQGKMTEAQWNDIADKHDKFRASYKLACDVAAQDYTQFASADLIRLETQLLETINALVK